MNFISKKARIGKNVKFGNFVTVYDNVEIGDNCIIDSYCEIGISNGREKGPLKLGANSRIRSHSVIYCGTEIGKNLVTGHFVTIRENAKIGQGLQLGIQSVVQGECIIGDHVKIFSVVNIPKRAKIGNFVWIFSYTVLTNDPHPPSEGFLQGPEVDDYAVTFAPNLEFFFNKHGVLFDSSSIGVSADTHPYFIFTLSSTIVLLANVHLLPKLTLFPILLPLLISQYAFKETLSPNSTLS